MARIRRDGAIISLLSTLRNRLPALSKKVVARIEEWEKDNDALWIDGKHFIDYMQHVEEEYAKLAEAARAEKKASRQKKFENDRRFGSKPEKRPKTRKAVFFEGFLEIARFCPKSSTR